MDTPLFLLRLLWLTRLLAPSLQQAQNAAIMLSTVALWVSQSAESDYEYNLTL